MEIPEALERVELRASDDDVKTDPELWCVDCGRHLCDAEPGDSLAVLARVVADHGCVPARPFTPPPPPPVPVAAQYAVRAADTAGPSYCSADLAHAIVAAGPDHGYTIGPDRSPITDVYVRYDADASWEPLQLIHPPEQTCPGGC